MSDTRPSMHAAGRRCPEQTDLVPGKGQFRWRFHHLLSYCCLAAKELTLLFPALWNTKKAAERWIEKNPPKNPPKAYRDIIRVLGGS